MGKQVKLLLRHKQQDFGPQTSMDQGGINAPLMGVELAIIGRMVVAPLFCKMQYVSRIISGMCRRDGCSADQPTHLRGSDDGCRAISSARWFEGRIGESCRAKGGCSCATMTATTLRLRPLSRDRSVDRCGSSAMYVKACKRPQESGQKKEKTEGATLLENWPRRWRSLRSKSGKRTLGSDQAHGC